MYTRFYRIRNNTHRIVFCYARVDLVLRSVENLPAKIRNTRKQSLTRLELAASRVRLLLFADGIVHHRNNVLYRFASVPKTRPKRFRATRARINRDEGRETPAELDSVLTWCREGKVAAKFASK